MRPGNWMKHAAITGAFLVLSALVIGNAQAGATNVVSECAGSGETRAIVIISWDGGLEVIHNVVLDCGQTVHDLKREVFPVGSTYDGHRITDLALGYEPVGSGTKSNTETGFVVQDGASNTLTLADYQAALLAQLAENTLFHLPALAVAGAELFAGVNLNEWIPHANTFAVGDVVDIANGRSASLPGFIVGTTPIGFSPTEGWTTAHPYTGQARVFASMDGGVLPEPGTVLLVLVALGLLRTAPGRRHSSHRI